MNASARSYQIASASVFTLVALFQVGRVLLDMPVQIAGTAVPMAASLGVAILAGALAVWGWRSR